MHNRRWFLPLPAAFAALLGNTAFAGDQKKPEFPPFEKVSEGYTEVVSTADGQRRAEYEMESPPVFDGLIAAGRRAFVTTVDGSVSCWK